MKITKYLHSCLLVEDKEKTVLIDPGRYTYEAKVFDIHSLTQLDYILITHEHGDHMHLPFLLEVIGKFPHATIVTNSSLVKTLAEQHIAAATTLPENISSEEVPHERVWDSNPPQNVLFHVFNKLTHPGDSLHFSESKEILALPIQAPWGSPADAVKKALSIKPKYIIPIHDWHWKDEVREDMYKRLTEFFATQGIAFKGLETGSLIEI